MAHHRRVRYSEVLIPMPLHFAITITQYTLARSWPLIYTALLFALAVSVFLYRGYGRSSQQMKKHTHNSSMHIVCTCILSHTPFTLNACASLWFRSEAQGNFMAWIQGYYSLTETKTIKTFFVYLK